MRIGHNIVAKLQEEGIEDVNDLGLVDNYFLNQITDNLKQPSGQINVGGVMVATPALKFGEKLQMRLDAALNIVALISDSAKLGILWLSKLNGTRSKTTRAFVLMGDADGKRHVV